ncbi:MAG: hypothetical protein MZV49_03070 [Rhodopseudomonas palustris]|nr:hypothetical protein [Rhodopseudomonas palustris]
MGFDFQPVMDRIDDVLAKAFPSCELTDRHGQGPGGGQEDPRRRRRPPPVDGYLVCQMNCLEPGRPDDRRLGQAGPLRRFPVRRERRVPRLHGRLSCASKTPNVGFVASSRLGGPGRGRASASSWSRDERIGLPSSSAADRRGPRQRGRPGAGRPRPAQPTIAERLARRAIACRKMKESKILAVGGSWQGIDPATTMMGIPVVIRPFAEVNEAWAAADKDESAADRRPLAEDRGAWSKASPATTLDDLGGDVPRPEGACSRSTAPTPSPSTAWAASTAATSTPIPASASTSCSTRAWSAACECDVRSTATMVAGDRPDPGPARLHLRPGHRHGQAADHLRPLRRRRTGPSARRARPIPSRSSPTPRTARAPRSARSCPLGYMTTTLEISDGRKEILFHQAKAVDNDPDDRACRTKLCRRARRRHREALHRCGTSGAGTA